MTEWLTHHIIFSRRKITRSSFTFSSLLSLLFPSFQSSITHIISLAVSLKIAEITDITRRGETIMIIKCSEAFSKGRAKERRDASQERAERDSAMWSLSREKKYAVRSSKRDEWREWMETLEPKMLTPPGRRLGNRPIAPVPHLPRNTNSSDLFNSSTGLCAFTQPVVPDTSLNFRTALSSSKHKSSFVPP